MGIRFYCPNGHKLNVKAFLAGKRGICPHCDARFQIPLESQIPELSPPARPELVSVAEPRQLDPPSVQLEEPGTRPVPDLAPLIPPAESSSDALGEAPQAVWYVRPPTGGQFGPALGDVMQRWIAEGRVCADCLVWREGWTDWKPAGPIFPTLAEETRVTVLPQVDVNPAGDAATPGQPSHVIRDAVRMRRKTAGRGKSLAAVIVLTLLIVALLVMLVVVLQQSP